jgi:amino acid adenylation domain-containing protein
MVNFDKSYQYINERANRLAHRLRSLGGGSGKLIGIMVEPSLALIIGLLGILKSGSAYVPIDYKYPPARCKYILDDCGVDVLLTREQFSETVKDIQFNGRIIDSFEESSHEEKIDNPPSYSTPGNLCYVIYTSGSTGKPKGVMIEHKNVVNLVRNFNYIDVSKEDRLLLTGSIGFDITTFEIWGSLLKGIKLYIGYRDLVLHYNNVKDVVISNNISLLHLIPQLFDHYASQVPEIFSKLRYLLVGGDFVRPKYINEIRKKNHRLKVLHMYGPTENTTFSTFYPVEHEYTVSIPIGKPIAHSQVYILNPYGDLQPIGMAGQLCTGGAGVARGYLNQPGLTSEKFDHDLWDLLDYYDGYHRSHRSSRSYITHKSYIYKTGDLARWLPDGNIEFLGRIDHQVKIRGYRIELGEIENRLLKHGKIREAIVLAKEDISKDKYLVAYLVSDTDLHEPELKDYLLKNLPAYMIPAHFIRLDKIPVTPNGKLDRKALPAPGITSGQQYIAPRDEIEMKLVDIWDAVLGISPGIDDDFFSLGGHSLKAMTMLARIHKAFHVKVPLTEIFKRPTIRNLSQYINQEVEDNCIFIKPVEKKEYYASTSAQKRLYILQEMDRHSTAYNMPAVIPVFLQEGREKLEETTKQLFLRHESFRTSFHLLENEVVQRVHSGAGFKIEYYESRSSGRPAPPGQEKERKEISDIIKRFVKPFDLSQAPLVRVGLITLYQNNHLFMVDCHHIISDGTSQQITARDLMLMYHGRQLPGLPLRYRDFSEWCNSGKQRERIKRQEAYWLKRFEDKIPVLELRTDYPRPEQWSFAGAGISAGKAQPFSWCCWLLSMYCWQGIPRRKI